MAMGRPPYYNNPEEMQAAINAYFLDPDCDYTISGLAYELGFCSRQSFYEYEDKPDFTYTIKRARTFIERAYERKLAGQSCTGAIFALKNLGWQDRVINEHDGAMTMNWEEVKTYETKPQANGGD